MKEMKKLLMMMMNNKLKVFLDCKKMKMEKLECKKLKGKNI